MENGEERKILDDDDVCEMNSHLNFFSMFCP
jgi:hypothetical protein